MTAGEIPNLLAALDGHDQERQLAMEKLFTLGALVVPPLCDLLADGRGRAARAAAEILGRLRDPRAYDHLLLAIGAANPLLAGQALKSVLAYDRPDAALDLVEMLPRAHLMVQQSIVRVLQRLGDRRAVPGLVAALDGAVSPTMRCGLIQALGSLGDQSLLPVLHPFADDPDHHVREWTALVITRLAKT